MIQTMPIAKGRTCPECGLNTMQTLMASCKVGRTLFLADSCSDCGFLFSYNLKLPRPAWHWITLGLAIMATCGLCLWIWL